MPKLNREAKEAILLRKTIVALSKASTAHLYRLRKVSLNNALIKKLESLTKCSVDDDTKVEIETTIRRYITQSNMEFPTNGEDLKAIEALADYFAFLLEGDWVDIEVIEFLEQPIFSKLSESFSEKQELVDKVVKNKFLSKIEYRVLAGSLRKYARPLKNGHRGKSTAGTEAVRQMANSLAPIYKELSGCKKITVTKDPYTNKRQGGFVSFMECIMRYGHLQMQNPPRHHIKAIGRVAERLRKSL